MTMTLMTKDLCQIRVALMEDKNDYQLDTLRCIVDAYTSGVMKGEPLPRISWVDLDDPEKVPKPEVPEWVKLNKESADWLEKREKELDKKVRQADERRKKWNQKNKELKKQLIAVKTYRSQLGLLVDKYGNMENSADLLAQTLMGEDESDE